MWIHITHFQLVVILHFIVYYFWKWECSFSACLPLSQSVFLWSKEVKRLIIPVERYLMFYWGVWHSGLTGYLLSKESPNYRWSGAPVAMTTWLKFVEVLAEWGNDVTGLSDKMLSWSAMTNGQGTKLQSKLLILVNSFLMGQHHSFFNWNSLFFT